MKTVTVLVRVGAPEGVAAEDVVDYVKDAVTAHCGAFMPSDPMFYFREWIIEVRQNTRRRSRK